MQSFQDQPTRERKTSFPSQNQPSPARPSPSLTDSSKAASFFGGAPPLQSLSYPLHAFHQAARFSKKGQVSGRREDFLLSQTKRRARLSDSPGRKGYKETSGEVAVEDVIMLRKKRFVGFLFRNPRSSIVVSWFVIVQDKWKEVRKKKIEERKKRYKGNGWYQCRVPKALTPKGSHS